MWRPAGETCARQTESSNDRRGSVDGTDSSLVLRRRVMRYWDRPREMACRVVSRGLSAVSN